MEKNHFLLPTVNQPQTKKRIIVNAFQSLNFRIKIFGYFIKWKPKKLRLNNRISGNVFTK